MGLCNVFVPLGPVMLEVHFPNGETPCVTDTSGLSMRMLLVWEPHIIHGGGPRLLRACAAPTS